VPRHQFIDALLWPAIHQAGQQIGEVGLWIHAVEFAGLERGAEPKYGPEHDRCILAKLDDPPLIGYANWTAPLLSREPPNSNLFQTPEGLTCFAAWTKSR
jgi:hypothetical protein